MALGIGLLQEVDFFFRKIQRRLDQHAQVDQRIAQPVNLFGKIARQGTAGAAGCCFCAGVDQIGNRFGLRQIDFVVQKSTFRKLTRLRHPQTRQTRLARGRVGFGRRLEATRYQQLQHHRPTVRLQLQHVFTGEGVRGHKVQRQAVVNRAAIGIGKRQVGGFTGFQLPPAQRLNQRRQLAARHPHNAHRPATGCGGDGDDGLLVSGEHGGLGRGEAKKAACAALWVGLFYLNLGKLNCGGTPMRVLIIHC